LGRGLLSGALSKRPRRLSPSLHLVGKVRQRRKRQTERNPEGADMKKMTKRKGGGKKC
jgi:hypothetical protein